MQYLEEAFPSHNEDINLEEYESIKTKVNSKYDCDLSAIEVRNEFEVAYNKIFDSLMVEHSHEVFNIIYVLMDCFNINEVKAVRYLNQKNREIIRAFAINRCETFYYENIEKKNQKEKAIKKGLVYHEYDNINDLFN